MSWKVRSNVSSAGVWSSVPLDVRYIAQFRWKYYTSYILNILRNIVDLERKGQVSGCLESSPLDVENKRTD